ncbi:MAG: hypothetical protein KGJ62_00145 [Armatimonadetes bacterium]|nr:hypothetical protein [Armatimonadota bacterium]MDE2206033.1 hypothetical protein [Armatimonadota bacterium]
MRTPPLNRIWHGPLCPVVCLLAITIGSGARAQVSLRLDLKDGDKVSDVAPVLAHAYSKAGINSVTFAVDGTLAATVASVPYLFNWDTIATTEGAHTLTVTATDADGATKSASVQLTVDNGLGVGSHTLAKQADAAFKGGDRAGAVKFARRALKADPNETLATLVQARVTAADGDLAGAIALLSKAPALATDLAAEDQLASWRITLALAPENTASFASELQAAVKLRQSAADQMVARLRQGSPSLTAVIGMEQMRAGDYDGAITTYTAAGAGDAAAAADMNHLALAYILDGRYFDAITLLRVAERAGRADSNSHALRALALLRETHFASARAQITAADLDGHCPACSIVAAIADVALAQPDAAAAEAQQAAKLLPNSADTQYALSLATPDERLSETALHQAIELDPVQPGPLQDHAVRLAQVDTSVYSDAALALAKYLVGATKEKLAPSILEAMVDLILKDSKSAQVVLTALYHDDKTSPDLLMALATYWHTQDEGSYSSTFMGYAASHDKKRFDWNLPRNPREYLQKVYRGLAYRVLPFLELSTLSAQRAVAGG